MDNKEFNRQHRLIKQKKESDGEYFDVRKNEFEKKLNKVIEDNSAFKEYRCIYCDSNKVEICDKAKFMGSKIDMEARVIKFYCSHCNCHFYLKWEDLL
jgi:hypothetical protein